MLIKRRLEFSKLIDKLLNVKLKNLYTRNVKLEGFANQKMCHLKYRLSTLIIHKFVTQDRTASNRQQLRNAKIKKKMDVI